MKKRKKRQRSRFFSILMVVSLITMNFMSPIQVLAEHETNTVIENGEEIYPESIDSTEDNEDNTVEQAEENPGLEVIDDVESVSGSKRNIVNVNNFNQLRNAIQTAPTNGSVRVININSNIVFPEIITLPARSNISIVSNNANVTRTLSMPVNQAAGRIGGTSLFLVENGSSLQLDFIALEQNNHVVGRANDAVRVRSGGNFVLSGGSSISSQSSGVAVSGNSTFTMRPNSTITAITAVFALDESTFTMTGGTIRESARGVSVNANSTFRMTGGTISNNGINSGLNSGGAGAGIHAEGSARVILEGGTISNNSTGSRGGGVALFGNSTFTMTGGTINNNSSHSNGGGIYAGSANARAILEGGTISNNRVNGNGGGVFINNLNNLTVSSRVTFSNNQAGSTRTPPINVASVFPNIQTTSASIHRHPLNNRDISFTGITRTLSVARTPEEGGDVTIEGNVNLSSGEVIPETDVTIVAEPTTGYRFTGWTSSNGGSFANATSATTTFTMGTTNATVTAVFERITHNLTLQANPTSGGAPTADQTTVAQGGSTQINANPNEGYRFVRWEVTNANPAVQLFQHVNAGGWSIEINETSEVTNLSGRYNNEISSVVLQPGVSITLYQNMNFSGRSLTLHNTSDRVQTHNLTNANLNFNDITSSFRVAVGSRGVTNATNQTTTFTMGTADATVTAVFERITHNLTLQASPTSGGSLTADQTTVAQGGTTQINANPNEGYRFVRWEVTGANSEVADATSPTTTFTMGTANATVTAVFERITHNLTLQANPASGGSVTIGIGNASHANLEPGEIITINANPNPGYRFVGWKLDEKSSDVVDSTSPTTTFTMGTTDVTVTALFAGELMLSEMSQSLPFEEVDFLTVTH